MSRNKCLRALCRDYLRKLRYLANKHGMGSWIDETIKETYNPNCKPTEHEVELLSRAVNDERLTRTEIPPLLGKNYRECTEDGDFDRIRKLPRQGIYSKVSAILYENERKR